MIASLPMYDRPANAAAHDALWVLIRDNLRGAGVAAPDRLDRDVDYMAGWERPDLVLGQICNLPLRAMPMGKVTVIGTSVYGLKACPRGHYNSYIIVHRDRTGADPRAFSTARLAVNSLMSHSGYGAPQAWAKLRGFVFSAPFVTGSHDASLCAVATRRADIAAVDAQTWWMQQADMDEVAEVAIIGVTPAAPGQTFITRAGEDKQVYFAAIEAALADLTARDQTILGLRGIHNLPQSDFDMPMPPLPVATLA